jgi:hypothetical protein
MRDPITPSNACQRRTLRLGRALLCITAAAVALPGSTCLAQENPAEIIAAHIRTQGYACDKALSAQRNRKVSRPNETVWLLRCSNGIYNVTLVPDLAAKVVLIKDEKQN